MQQKGFSLIELLIAMLIIALLATIGINGWQDLKLRSELANTTRQLLAFLNEVKLYANLYNQNQTVHYFQWSENSWCLAVTTEKRPIDCQTYFQFIAHDNNIKIIGLAENNVLVFYGRRSTAQPTTIKLTNEVGEARIIISTRGRVRFCSYRTYLSGFVAC